MKKTNFRDYAVQAFRYYALCGRPTADQLHTLRNQAPEDMRGALEDLEAVHRVITHLRTAELDGAIKLKTLEIVYMSNPWRYPGRNELTERARAASSTLYTSESQVYRHLHRIRELLARERGLRLSDDPPPTFMT